MKNRPPHPTLTVADRCDACGAQARAHIALPSGGQLFMCRHHVLHHETAIWDAGGDIDYQFGDLSPTPTQAAVEV